MRAFFGPHPAIPGSARARVIGGSGGLVACAESETMVLQPFSAAAARTSPRRLDRSAFQSGTLPPSHRDLNSAINCSRLSGALPFHCLRFSPMIFIPVIKCWLKLA